MPSITKGGNLPLPSGTTAVTLVLGWTDGPDIDASALLLTGTGKVRDDSDFVFYNQPSSPEGSARHLGKRGTEETLGVDLARLPAAIEAVAVAASTDGAPFGRVSGLHLRVLDAGDGTEIVRFDVPSATTETAFVLGELYKRNDAWKFRAVGAGWASGLAGLAGDYGISVDDEPAVTAPPAAAAAPITMTKAVRLEKQLQGQPPAMIDMVKRAGVCMEKRGMSTERARVALCLDISGSMYGLYQQGKVQQLCERVLALAVQLDDDGQCDVFTFGTGGYVEGPLDLRNHQGYVQQLLSYRDLEGGTNYALAIQAVRRHYFPAGGGGPLSTPHPDPLPVYVMFVTDGQTTDENGTRNHILWSSYEPIFWQFMAIGQSSRNVAVGGAPAPKRRGFLARLTQVDFQFLEELDDMGGRFLDNADFFSVADPAAIPDDQLFDLMMTEYPKWLAAARQQGLLPMT